MSNQRQQRMTEIISRVNAATPGPWSQTQNIKTGVKIWGRDSEPLFASIPTIAHSRISADDPVPQWQKDADFVRCAREDVIWLLTELAASGNDPVSRATPGDTTHDG